MNTRPLTWKQVDKIKHIASMPNGYSDGVKANETILRLIATADYWRECYLRETVG